MRSEKHSRNARRRDRHKNDNQDKDAPRTILQAPPVILERRDRHPAAISSTLPAREVPESQVKPQILGAAPIIKEALNIPVPKVETEKQTVIPFYRKQSKFNTEAVLKVLGDYPGHFVVGVIGQQGVGKSAILSSFTEDPANTFPTQHQNLFLQHGHKTNGIDLYVTSERTILLDTEPIMCWSVLDKALRNGSLDGLHPDIWLEMDTLYNLIFLLNICNVLILVSEGSQIDMTTIKYLQRAEMLKFDIPHFPLIPPSALGQSHPDTNAYPDIVFVANQCHDDDFTWQHYEGAQSVLKHLFADSQLRTKGLVSLGKALPAFRMTADDTVNLFFLPYSSDAFSDHNDSINNLNRVTDVDNGYPRSSTACSVESYDVLITALRDQVMAAPRLTGKKGQISEKEWFRNAMKSYELARKSEYISEYLKIVRKLRDG